MNFYFDTSALVKHFHQEKGTDIITSLIRNKDHQIYLLDIAPIELLSAVYRRQGTFGTYGDAETNSA